MSLAVMENEVGNQPEDLHRFAARLANEPNILPKNPGPIFTGSGDSYAAALFAREISNGYALAIDPYELLMNPALARKRNLVLVSISGRTKSNIDLATSIRGTAKKRIAVTSDPESPLAETCDASIILEYRKLGRPTSGTSSFTASVLACAHLLRALPKRLELSSALMGARAWAESVIISDRGLCIFVGSGVDRALAEYGACKVEEVLGARALPYYPEQVGHSLLFSLNPAQDTIICINSLRRAKIDHLSGLMSRSGFKMHRISSGGRDVVTKSLAASFYLQYLALVNAKRRGMTEVAFLHDRKRLTLSNKLIY